MAPDINASAATATLEADTAVRLGLGAVRTIGSDLAERIAAGRPYADMTDVVRRCALTTPQVEALATAGAFHGFGLERREALWTAGAVAQVRADRLDGIVVGERAPQLPGMSDLETAAADLWATGVSPDASPTQFSRQRLDALGVTTAAGLRTARDHGTVVVGGVVTHRQRPATANETVFLNLEDETGLVNVICSKGVWARHRRVAREQPALLIRGRLERFQGVINVIARDIAPLNLTLADAVKSRDFH